MSFLTQIISSARIILLPTVLGRSGWKKDILKWNFSMQTPSSVWPLHMSNTRIDAAPILSRILSKHSPVSYMVLFPDVEHLMNKFTVAIFASFWITIGPNYPLDSCNKFWSNGPTNFPACVHGHLDREWMLSFIFTYNTSIKFFWISNI